ncbi:chemokine (C-X-C motif) ligand 18a, duplicate 1 isoform X2 [Neoarius graeffei]|nr:chemokine (C-X-C motif) ligand 18a, duplicate 1 isoform X2 [Neoarius graeffei]
MAFRNLQQIFFSLLLFLLFCLNVFTDMTAGVYIREKCMCIQESYPIPWKNMTDFKVIDSGPHCKKVQIIISMGSKDTCLAPNSKQGKKMQQCWKR